MARFTYLETLGAIIDSGLVPVFYNADMETSRNVIGAVAKGGSRCIEWTNRGDFADEQFGELMKWARKEHPGLILGVGSVEDAPTAVSYMQKGADFVVGPVSRKEVAVACNRRNIPYSPGCSTPTEVLEAEEAGALLVKVFPGQVLTSSFVKALLGPRKRCQIMPTGGVSATAKSIYEWLSAGVSSMGIGSSLISKDLVAAKDWDALSAKVAQCLHWIKVGRNKLRAAEGEIFLRIHHMGIVSENLDATLDGMTAVGFNLRQRNGSGFVTLGGGSELEIGPADGMREHGHLAIEVTDMDKALEIVKAQGIEPEGEPLLRGTVKLSYLKGEPWGLKIPTHFYCLYSEEIDEVAGA